MALHNELKLVSNLFGSDLKLYIFPLWWMNYSWSYFMKVREFISNILVSQISGDLLDPSLKIKQTMISSKLMWASHCILALTKYRYQCSLDMLKLIMPIWTTKKNSTDIYFPFQVRISSGKPMTIVASKKGFYPAGKRILLTHSLVGLLQQISRIFNGVSNILLVWHVSPWFIHCLHILASMA